MLDFIKALFKRTPLVGTVVDKKSYGAGGGLAVSASTTGAWMQAVDTPDIYLIVQDATGKRHDVWVEAMTFNNTEIGDKWPPSQSAS